MWFPTKCVVFLACWAAAFASPAVVDDADLGTANVGPVGRGSSVRDPKLLFKFITIAPEACTTTAGRSGICYSAADCTTLDGTAEGNCASGLGVCCRITRTCDQTSSFQETTFVNRNYPSTESTALGGCQLRITPLNNNICQLRLDFDEFTLSQPNNEGDCDLDFLQVTGGSSSIPKICGDNSGQHMYVDVSPQFGSALINVDTASMGAKWNIKVTQIECNSSARAPPGCLQFFTETTGTISSFNFNPARTQTQATRQLADQRYGMCIKSQPGYCSITYRQRDGSQFSLSRDPTGVNPALPGIPIVGLSAPDPLERCENDYLLIPGGEFDDTNVVPAGVIVADRFCGTALPTVTSSVLPFNLFFVSNDVENDPAAPDINNQGFQLTYRMNPC